VHQKSAYRLFKIAQVNLNRKFTGVKATDSRTLIYGAVHLFKKSSVLVKDLKKTTEKRLYTVKEYPGLIIPPTFNHNKKYAKKT
jgi:hypothetical protein